MKRKVIISVLLLVIFAGFSIVFASSGGSDHLEELDFPLPLDSYSDAEQGMSLSEVLIHRIEAEPLNLIVSLIFLFAIIHTFLTSKFRSIAHKIAVKHQLKLDAAAGRPTYAGDHVEEVSFGAEFFHFMGEIEVVFGMWLFVLFGAFALDHGVNSSVLYMETVNFTEPMFVVIIMALASTRPIMTFAESCLKVVAKLGKGSPAAWWLTILTIGPLLGSFITEPGAMTISALLLAKQFYHRKPSVKFAYATIGLLFVNISVGGTLTHFAAPPVLMVAGKWNWDLPFMLANFGWKAAIGIVITNILYFVIFRSEFGKLQQDSTKQDKEKVVDWQNREEPIPVWITCMHIVFMIWTVLNAHHPAFFIGGFLFYIGFAQATAHHQNRLELKSPLLVGFFLAGLVIHGGLQAWWIAPILGSLGSVTLMVTATVLTAFNDNAAITYLSTLVPGFTDTLKYAVVAGAVTGGGLTVIANAPNPAGQSILNKFFENGVSPMGLAAGAMIPTIIMGLAFMVL